MVPNIVHFVWFTGPNSREFSLINAMAIQAAADVQKPDAIYLHCNVEPVGNPHWDRIKPIVTIAPTEAPTEHKGVTLVHPQYQSDLVRLQVLKDQGGIYLDTDTLLIKPLPWLSGKVSCVMSPDTSDNPQGMNAGVIIAEANAPFILKWLEALDFSGAWAESSSGIPWRLYQEDKALLKLVRADQLIPLHPGDDRFFGTDMTWAVEAKAVHVWESFQRIDRPVMNEAWFRGNDNCLTQLFGKYLPEKKLLKIAVYAIAKDEAMFVERFCNSAKAADLIFIADTGSTDETVALAEQHGAKTASIFISPWRFDLARNAALALLPADIDVCVSLDLDEELQPGWREEIERVWIAGVTTRLKYRFDWGVGIVFWYEKIHARKGYRWHHPCHEYPVPDRIVENWAQTRPDLLMVIHKPDPTKSRGQYLDLLRVSIQEDPQDPRNAFYFARELSFNSHWQEAIEQSERYLALPGATWDGERCYAMRVLTRCHAELGQWDKALAWARRACSEAPGTREPWCELANACYRTGRWAECYGAALSALAIVHKEELYTCDPAVWGYQAHDYAAIAAWNLGLKEEGLRHAKDALALAPDDQRLKANVLLMSHQPINYNEAAVA